MVTRAKTNVHLAFKSEKQLVALLNALKPEIDSPATHRAKVDLKRQENILVLLVDADDIVALRATVNAYLHWIASTVNVIELIDHF